MNCFSLFSIIKYISSLAIANHFPLNTMRTLSSITNFYLISIGPILTHHSNINSLFTSSVFRFANSDQNAYMEPMASSNPSQSNNAHSGNPMCAAQSNHARPFTAIENPVTGSAVIFYLGLPENSSLRKQHPETDDVPENRGLLENAQLSASSESIYFTSHSRIPRLSTSRYQSTYHRANAQNTCESYNGMISPSNTNLPPDTSAGIYTDINPLKRRLKNAIFRPISVLKRRLYDCIGIP